MISNQKTSKSYTDRPDTPLGDASGLTSTPVSEHPTRPNSPPQNPYHYQPAIASTRPELSVLRRSSSNYIQASTGGSPPTGEDAGSPTGPGRTFSFSAEDLKRSKYEPLVSGKDGVGEQPLKSPGIGNSRVKGRDFGFTSTG